MASLFANSEDPDQTPQNAESGPDFHCLPYNPLFKGNNYRHLL